jgi:hypothetical protein
MSTNQTATLSFFVPLTLAYLSGCGAWLLLRKQRPAFWPPEEPPKTDRPYLDLAAAILAVLAILLVGQVYRAGYLLSGAPGWASRLAWSANNLVIYSPIAIALALRRQGPGTIYLSARGLGKKLGFGAAAGGFAVTLFLSLRGEARLLPAVLAGAVEIERLVDFLPVFLEGVALAFLLVRLRWVGGGALATLLPAALFALAHIPSQLAAGMSPGEMAAFFGLNTLLVAALLQVTQRSQDIIWLGVVHYLMDIAIGAI